MSAFSQTADDLKNDHLTPGDVLVYGMGYSGQRYSPLTRITADNITSLSLACSSSGMRRNSTPQRP